MRRKSPVGPRYHGDRRTRLYSIWTNMLTRCRNPNNRAYRWYGAKGVTVCDEWLSYRAFRDWALSSHYQDTLTLERNDGSKGYSPDNCSWTIRRAQSVNAYNVAADQDGVPYVHIARRNGLSSNLYAARLSRGWTPERAANEPRHWRGARA